MTLADPCSGEERGPAAVCSTIRRLRKSRYLASDYDLAAGCIGLHQSMCVLDVFKTKDLGWLGLVAARRGAIDDRLEWNFAEREFRRTGNDRAGKYRQVPGARDLKYRFERQRATAAKKTDDTGMAAALEHGERVEHRGVADDVQYGIDALRMTLTNAIGELRRFHEHLIHAQCIEHRCPGRIAR